ncbi:MAG: hypothetical protein QF752_06760 [Planctomycetota bacterium]|nr:hypothetical protein [Planctomycetota bacterium]
MKSNLRNILSVTVDSFLLIAIVAVPPFAWILRDGLHEKGFSPIRGVELEGA